MEYKSLTTPAATGGTITTTATHRIHTFTSSGTFVANKSMNVDYLIVAGGGGGGMMRGGGGGAGGFVNTTGFAISPGNINVVVGTGGTGSNGPTVKGASGNNSSFSTIVAVGGGGGGSRNTSDGASGGSGGGATDTGAIGIGTSGQGYNGGLGDTTGSYYSGGGGGGAGTAGGNATHLVAGNGGGGASSSITGTLIYYAGGGGGAAEAGGGGMRGTGGIGGGGNGGAPYASGSDGTYNLGGGGGGGSYTGNVGGNGGSGIVIIRYLLSEDLPSPANITATLMTINPSENPCRTGICTVTVNVTWTNNGESTGSFVPSITVSSGTVAETYPSEPLAAGAPVTHSFTISGMTVGVCSICPNPS